MKLKGRREKGEPLHTAMYTVYIIHDSLDSVIYAARAPLSHAFSKVLDYLGSILEMSWTRGMTAQQRRRDFRSTRFTERKEACSLLTLPQVLAKILTIQSLGGATSVAKYPNYRVLQ